MTLSEYALQVEAWNLAEVDRQYWTHLQAYLGLAVKATKGRKQKPKYSSFDKFFDFDKELNRRKQVIYGEKKSRFPSLSKHIKEVSGG